MITGHPLLQPGVKGAIERAMSDHLGQRWVTQGFTDLNSRASHPCGVLQGRPISVFAKLDTSDNATQTLQAEINGLTLLRDRARITVPTRIGTGPLQVDGGFVLLTEALSERPPKERTSGDWRAIGRTLATVHRVHGEHFGLEDFDGFFGALPQDNKPVPSDTWAEFYVERRVLPHLRSAIDTGLLPDDLGRDIERLTHRLPSLCGPELRPTLLHGDAQQHNFISTESGAVVTVAAPYYGHPEIDLMLLDYFQPVPREVFDAYREIAPIDASFADRRDLWCLFVDLACISVRAAEYERSALDRMRRAVCRYR
jgi:fructosamine-3-kinase